MRGTRDRQRRPQLVSIIASLEAVVRHRGCLLEGANSPRASIMRHKPGGNLGEVGIFGISRATRVGTATGGGHANEKQSSAFDTIISHFPCDIAMIGRRPGPLVLPSLPLDAVLSGALWPVCAAAIRLLAGLAHMTALWQLEGSVAAYMMAAACCWGANTLTTQEGAPGLSLSPQITASHCVDREIRIGKLPLHHCHSTPPV